MIDDGRITRRKDPKSLYEYNSVYFTQRKLSPFCTRLNNLKKEHAHFLVFFQSDLDELECTCIVPVMPDRKLSKKRRIKAVDPSEIAPVEKEDEDDSTGLEFLLGSHAF